VRVSVSQTVPLYFLSIIGITEVPITVAAVSETASVDIFLVIDTSESMAFGDEVTLERYDPMLDPSQCNAADPEGTDPDPIYGPEGDLIPGECQPFESVKRASLKLLASLFERFDRVGIITFDQYPRMELALTDNFLEVKNKLINLTVMPDVGPCEGVPQEGDDNCRFYTDSGYEAVVCSGQFEDPPDKSRCGSTNIGGAMRMAGNALGGNYPPGGPSSGVRDDALWVVILLSDGAANAGFDEYNEPYCPDPTWLISRFCRDLDARPSITDEFDARHTIDETNYDADDYARDQVDFVWKDQNALIFSIGLGNGVLKISDNEVTNTPPGETLLQYAAKNGFGIYRYAPNGAQLADIFNEIGSKIATRLNR